MSTSDTFYVPHGSITVSNNRKNIVSVRRTHRPTDKPTARALINGYYTDLYGPQIRYETTRSMRLKIQEIEQSMIACSSRYAYAQLVRECVAYERVCELLEILT